MRNPSSTDKESRMQYPWHRIENPRQSDFLAWAHHCFQLDKIKDIMCFHYYIFQLETNPTSFNTLICKFFISEKRKQFIFPMSRYLAVFYCQWNEQIRINYHYCDTKNWINESHNKKYQRIATLCLASIFRFVSTCASLAPHPLSKSQWKN